MQSCYKRADIHGKGDDQIIEFFIFVKYLVGLLKA